MPNFSVQIPGEAEPRSFRLNVAEKALYTDIDAEHPVRRHGDPKRGEDYGGKSAESDPLHELYWVQTATYREAYRMCEEEGVSLDAAFAQANGQPTPPPSKTEPSSKSESQHHRAREVNPIDAPDADFNESNASPIAGIVITNQRLLLKFAFQLLDQYVDEEDKNHELLQLLKREAEDIDEHEIII